MPMVGSAYAVPNVFYKVGSESCRKAYFELLVFGVEIVGKDLFHGLHVESVVTARFESVSLLKD